MKKSLTKHGIGYPILLVLLISFAGFYSCKKESGNSEVPTEYSETDLLNQAQRWFRQQSGLPAIDDVLALDVKSLKPDWSKPTFAKNSDGEGVVGIPMGSFNNNFVELNVTVKNDQSYGVIKHFVFLSETTAYLHVYAGNGKLISEGNYDRVTHQYSGSKKYTWKSPLHGKQMSTNDEGIPLEQVDITAPAPGPQPPVVIPSGPVTPPNPTLPPSGNTGVNGVVITAPPSYLWIDVQLYTYLSVFNCMSQATVTIYADQPVAGSSTAWRAVGTDIDVGHTYISIQQDGKTRVIGYYPKNPVYPTLPTSPSTFTNDSVHSYDVKYSKNVSGDKLCDMLAYIKSGIPATYNLDTFNCTTFAITAVNKAGLGIPANTGTWPGGGGCNPGVLGENLKSLSGWAAGPGSGPMNSSF